MNKRIEHLATQAGLKLDELPDEVYLPLEQFAKLVAEHECEACAKLAEEYVNGLERNYSEIIADAIRARRRTRES